MKPVISPLFGCLLLATAMNLRAQCSDSPLHADGFETAASRAAQWQDCIIDEGLHVMGLRHFALADLNGDTSVDLVTAHAFNVDRVGVYFNRLALGTGFSAQLTVETTIDDPIHSVVADLDGDDWPDIAVLGQTSGVMHVYRGSAQGFAAGQALDQGRPLGNGVVAGDFDADGDMDLAVIGQHAIDLLRNQGAGSFVLEHILTTESSPLILECMDIEAVDFDLDGDLDLLTAETLGLVLYRNDGTGHFDAQVLSSHGFTTPVLHVLHANKNALPDVLTQTSHGQLRLFLDPAISGVNAGIVLDQVPAARSWTSTDIDGDGHVDLVGAYFQGHWGLRSLRGLGDGSFESPQELFAAPDLTINEVAVADLDGDGLDEVLYSAVNARIGYLRRTP